MSKNIQAIRGMNDLLPADSDLWLFVEKVMSDLFTSYGYKYISTPIVEKSETFCRAIGEATDIVEKEMYTWKEQSGDSLSLRPEGTAGCVRSMIEHNLPREGIQKVFYRGPMFRHERPQKGRYRQFHQIGVEVFGANGPKIDAELMSMTNSLWHKLGLKDVTLNINTLGSSESRLKYKEILRDYFLDCKDSLDADSIRRLEKNPLRILDSKNIEMQSIIENAPKLMDNLDDESRKHYNDFINYLECLNIPFQVDTKLVRGLDYYNRTVFEWTTNELGSQGAICAGGRYDSLVELMGGKPTPGVGFAIGIERIVLLLQKLDLLIPEPLSIYIMPLADDAQIKSMQIADDLHAAFPEAILYNDISHGNIKNQFKRANKANAGYALILGNDEISNNQVSIKPLKGQGEQITVSIEKMINYFKEGV
ncbi:MAG: histidine--tRNA ligase [Gammaproteobacteria bacterium]|nr:histidine--tRNA ligase [Gammaproteobacteria bacterium]|tara:strand:- start:2027 stop:3292 length:1266 start_codon:yes stop_codon:yes gene_type:complete